MALLSNSGSDPREGSCTKELILLVSSEAAEQVLSVDPDLSFDFLFKLVLILLSLFFLLLILIGDLDLDVTVFRILRLVKEVQVGAVDHGSND